MPDEGDFIPPPDVADADERADALPQQEEFWRPPTRFGTVPVEKEPLGWDRHKGFRKLFPAVLAYTFRGKAARQNIGCKEEAEHELC